MVIRITICVGSSCSVRGSDELAAALEQFIARENLSAEIELVGSFCMNDCSNGVSVKVMDRQYHEILPQRAEEFFNTEILPLARESASV